MRKKIATLFMSIVLLFNTIVSLSAFNVTGNYHASPSASSSDVHSPSATPPPTPAPEGMEFVVVDENELWLMQEQPFLINLILDDTLQTPRYLLPVTDNHMLNILLYSPFDPAQVILENMD